MKLTNYKTSTSATDDPTTSGDTIPTSSHIRRRNIIRPINDFAVRSIAGAPSAVAFISTSVTSRIGSKAIATQVCDCSTCRGTSVSTLGMNSGVQLRMRCVAKGRCTRIRIADVRGGSRCRAMAVGNKVRRRNNLSLVLVSNSRCCHAVAFSSCPICCRINRTRLDLTSSIILGSDSTSPRTSTIRAANTRTITTTVGTSPSG